MKLGKVVGTSQRFAAENDVRESGVGGESSKQTLEKVSIITSIDFYYPGCGMNIVRGKKSFSTL